MRKLSFIPLAALTISLSGCGYNTFQSTDEQIVDFHAEVTH